MGLGTAVLVLCLAVMFWYSANKSLVIMEEHEQEGNADLDELIQIMMERKKEYDFTVIINPAHGGANLGNVVNEIEEKDITLAVGKMLVELAEDSDIGIFILREEDIDISNESRRELIAVVEPDVVIDLHVNADPDNERTFGTMVMYNADFYSERLTNVELADIMERQLVTAISGKANGIFADKEDKYPLLKMIQLPIVSIEMGYLTNSEEAALLNRSDYQKKLALGLYQGILKVREVMKNS